jgi:hypothetical protein
MEPGITAPITSKVLPSEVESSAAQPLLWLSPVIKILFRCDFEVHLFYFSQLLFSRPNLETERLLIRLGGYLVAKNDSRL